jgi:5-methylcytosine-specific restriction endonuclease McrA
MSRGRARTYFCFYCGKPLSRQRKTRDHIQPRSRGGSNAPRNVVDACRPCNNLKGCLTLEEFRLVIAFRQGLVKPAKMKFPGELKRMRWAEEDDRLL